jgi:ABC-2 type transport system permease protein
MRWPMIRLVAGREIRERMRTKTFVITTLVLLVASLLLVIIPAFVGDDGPDRQTIALAAPAAEGLDDALTAAAAAQDRELAIRDVDAAAAERLGAAGEVDAGVIVEPGVGPARVVVEKELSDRMRATISGGLSAWAVTAALRDAGVPPARIDAVTSPPALDVREAEPDEFSGGDLAVGYIAAIVLYLALLFSGAILASGVAEEKTSRVSEVLLASLRPVELLLGKVVGIGATTLLQLASAALPALVAAVALDVAELPATTGEVVAWAVVWFVGGYALYAAVYGALGSLVGRQQEVGQVTGLPAALLLVGYLGATFIPADPDAGLVVFGSILPPFAPMMMPMRVATGGVPPAQMALALALTVAAAAAAVWFGARVYRGGIVRTGARTKLRDALRSVTGTG